MKTIEIAMMVAFLLSLVFSAWKLYAFMPKEQLKDDDTNPKATQELMTLMYRVIHLGATNEADIFEAMIQDPSFDKKHFWRFNPNRLKQLLQHHYLNHPEHHTIDDISASLSTLESL